MKSWDGHQSIRMRSLSIGPGYMLEGGLGWFPAACTVSVRLTGADGILAESVAVNTPVTVVPVVGVPDRTPVVALSVRPSRFGGLIAHV